MLQKLHIKNFAIIEEVNVDFDKGFNVLTGETGAGKSILVDALASLLGNRLSSDSVRPGSKIAAIEASFDLSEVQLSAVREALAKQEVDVSSAQLTIRRELIEAGRSRSLVNEHVVGVAALKSIAPAILDVNMQGEHYALSASRNQLNILDEYAGCMGLRKRVECLYQERLRSLESVRDLVQRLEEGRRARDFVEFQLAEIAKVDPQIGEDEALLSERLVLANQDKISNFERGIYNTLYEDEHSIASQLNSVRKQLDSLSSLDPSYANHLEQLEAANALITDVAEEVFSIHNNRDWSEDRLEQVEARLSAIERLKRKYSNSLDEVLRARESLQITLDQVDGGSLRESEAKVDLKRIEEAYLDAANELSGARRGAAKPFGDAVAMGLRGLSLPDARFVIEVKELPTRETMESGEAHSLWSPTGLDRVEFLFSANRGMVLRPLAQVASGGELSRLSLIVQSVCRDNLSRETSFASTLLLDEVDVGVSGQVAETLGRNLAALSRKQQIVCITHQPQIARFADAHFVVRKTNTADKVKSDVIKLTHKLRVRELARLIAADEDAEVAQQTADWLLQNN